MKRSLPVLIALVLLFLTVGCNLNQEADFQKGKEAYEKEDYATAEADYEKGWDAYIKDDYATALREWRPLAEQGDTAAQYRLGTMYSNGEGIPKNGVYAYMWYNVAASAGDELGELAAVARDRIAKEMTPSQIERAQDLASECVEKKYKGCD